MEALDEVRREIWNEVYAEVKRLKKEHPRKPGRPKEDDPATIKIRKATTKADEIKNSAYALGNAPPASKDQRCRCSRGNPHSLAVVGIA